MELLKGAKIYLAGAMQYEEKAGESWRQIASKRLHEMGIGVINPLDNPSIIKESLDQQKYLNELCEDGKLLERIGGPKYAIDRIKETLKDRMKPIVGIDLRFVDISDALLCFINKEVHTAGTYAEISHALLQRKPVIIFTNTSIFDIPRWLWGHADYNLFFNSLDNALNYISSVNDGKVIHKWWKLFDYEKIYGVG